MDADRAKVIGPQGLPLRKTISVVVPAIIKAINARISQVITGHNFESRWYHLSKA